MKKEKKKKNKKKLQKAHTSHGTCVKAADISKKDVKNDTSLFGTLLFPLTPLAVPTQPHQTTPRIHRLKANTGNVNGCNIYQVPAVYMVSMYEMYG